MTETTSLTMCDGKCTPIDDLCYEHRCGPAVRVHRCILSLPVNADALQCAVICE